MTPGRYTELFFLDEATALAAGHRPCAECRRERFNAFREAWLCGNPGIIGSQTPSAVLIDECLHRERLADDRTKRLFSANVNQLPNGVFVRCKARGEAVYLLWNDAILAWSPGGYWDRRPRPRSEEVRVLTPKSTVGAIQAGYVPGTHLSASD
jgi:hypothetical protein